MSCKREGTRSGHSGWEASWPSACKRCQGAMRMEEARASSMHSKGWSKAKTVCQEEGEGSRYRSTNVYISFLIYFLEKRKHLPQYG